MKGFFLTTKHEAAYEKIYFAHPSVENDVLLRQYLRVVCKEWLIKIKPDINITKSKPEIDDLMERTRVLIEHHFLNKYGDPAAKPIKIPAELTMVLDEKLKGKTIIQQKEAIIYAIINHMAKNDTVLKVNICNALIEKKSDILDSKKIYQEVLHLATRVAAQYITWL